MFSHLTYGDKQYWDGRYKKDAEPFEWFQRYSGIQHVVKKYLYGKDRNILNLGCGTSELPRELFEDGYKKITSIDFSDYVIEVMKKRYKDKSDDLKFFSMDARQLSFPPSSFDAVIDKGCLEAVMCSEGSIDSVRELLREVFKVLRPKGLYFLVSYAPSKQRLPLLNDLNWDVKVETVPKPSFVPLPMDDDSSFHYIYICEKKGLDLD
ncbi:hypothetical protein ABK040_010657 [Willaertia magna]